MLEGIIKGSTHILEFVMDALFSGAIKNEDLKEWATCIIRDNDVTDIPDYIFELSAFNGKRTDLLEVIGFSFDWKCTKSQSSALYGIALKRGKELGEECSPKVAMKALEKHPEVEKQFREVFPFIKF